MTTMCHASDTNMDEAMSIVGIKKELFMGGNTSEAPPQTAQKSQVGAASLAQHLFAPLCGADIFYGRPKNLRQFVTLLAIEDV